jgi:hypothetical protein
MATWKKVLTKTPVALDLGASAQDGYVLTATGGDSTTPAWEASSGGSATDNAALLTLLGALESSSGASNESIGIGTDTGDTIQFAGNVTVDGDLTVSGDTVTLDVATLSVEDKIIELASGATDVATASGAGININTTNVTKEPTLEWTNVAGLAQWGLFQEGVATSYPILTQTQSTAAGTGNGAGVGSLHYDTSAKILYIRID